MTFPIYVFKILTDILWLEFFFFFYVTRIIPTIRHWMKHIPIKHYIHWSLSILCLCCFIIFLIIHQLLDLIDLWNTHDYMWTLIFQYLFIRFFTPPRWLWLLLNSPNNLQQPQIILLYTGTIWSDRISSILTLSLVPWGTEKDDGWIVIRRQVDVIYGLFSGVSSWPSLIQ